LVGLVSHRRLISASKDKTRADQQLADTLVGYVALQINGRGGALHPRIAFAA
jgi:hypothetical protein